MLVFTLLAGSSAAQPVISEFMASNDRSLADEDGDHPDWVEIHNPDAVQVSLAGWYLTDRADNLTKWRFPAITIPAQGYLIVFASDKDRAVPGANLHTSFALSAGGEYLGLVQADGTTVVSHYAPEFPPQITDVSYGIAGGVAGYLAEPTPGAANGSLQDVVLEESVSFSTGSTTFVGSITVTLAGAVQDQVIRYVLSAPSPDGGDVPDPTAESAVYTGPITVVDSQVISAAVFAADGSRHGVITTIQLLEIDGDGGTGLQSFSSPMPLVVVDNHGYGPMSGQGERSGERTGWLYTFEPGQTGRARLVDGPNASSLVDFEVRGQTSSLYPKQGFKFEMRNDWGERTPFDLLGLGLYDEWNLIAPYQWDTAFVRNAYVYDVSNAMGRWAARTRLAEAFLNQGDDGLNADDYHGVVVLADKTDVEPGRIDLTALKPSDNAGAAITGGYLLLVDEPDANKFHWQTTRGFPSTMDSVLQVDTPKIDDLTEPQKSYIVGYVQAMEDALHADAETGFVHRRHLEYIDRAAWVDHHLINVLFKNPDAFWRSSYYRKDRSQRLAAGPVWDFDRAFDSADPRDDDWNTWNPREFTSQGEAINYWEIGWWGVLASDPDFMQAWVDRWQSLRADGALRSGLMVDRLDHYRDHVASEAAARDAARWPENVSRFGSFAAELDHMQTWLLDRMAWIDLQFPARPRLLVNGDDSVTLVPPDRTKLVYTLTGADPRLRGGRLAPDAIVAEGAVTLPAGATFRARTLDESRTDFPSSTWSGAVPGAPGAPYEAHPRLSNVSTRTALAAGDAVVIGGFVIEEAAGKTLLIRGVGPALRDYGIEDALSNPWLQIFTEDGTLVASNQGWGADAAAEQMPDLAVRLGAFPLAAGSADAATLVTLPAGIYTVHLRSANGQAGTGLLEIYEANDIGSVTNLSVRGAAAGVNNPLVAGFVVDGNTPKRLLIRAVGPTLADYDVANVLQNPSLVLRREDEFVASNDDWSAAANADDIREAAELAGAFALADGTRDAAMLITVPPGVYTAAVTGVGGESGTALVEVYEIR